MPTTDHQGIEITFIKQAILGDKQAFGYLFEMYYEPIFKYMLSRLNSHCEAEDLTENVFLKAWEHLPSFGRKDKQRNFRAWLYRIAHNSLIDHYRNYRPETTWHEDIGHTIVATSPQDCYETKETIDRVSQYLAGLDDSSQHIIISRFIAGLSQKEIAHTMGISEGNVRVIQFRAIQKIRGLFGEENE